MGAQLRREAIDIRTLQQTRAKVAPHVFLPIVQKICYKGFKEPDAVSIQAAIELNDKFIDDLQAIHQRAQQLTLE